MKRLFLTVLVALSLCACEHGEGQTPKTTAVPAAEATAPPGASPSPSNSISPSLSPSPAPSSTPAPSPEQSASHSTRMDYETLVTYDGGSSDGLSMPSAGTYTIEVDVTNKVLSVLDANGALVRQCLCTIGRWDTPTPRGVFEMEEDRREFDYFDEYDCYAAYWSQINGEIFFHSLLFTDDEGEELIKSSYRNLGKASSHGCVRLTVPDAKWIYENVAAGSTVNITEKEEDKELTKSLKLPKP